VQSTLEKSFEIFSAISSVEEDIEIQPAMVQEAITEEERETQDV